MIKRSIFITNYLNTDDRYIFYYIHVLKKNITFALFHDPRKVFSKVNSSRNLIFKNVAQITERMDEVRLVDTVCRANNFASLKSSWNNPNSYHMAVLETFPPTQGEINANDAQINFLPPPKLWRRIPTTRSRYQIRGNSKSAEKNILARTIAFVCFPYLRGLNLTLTSLLTRFKGEIEDSKGVLTVGLHA